MFGFEYSDIDTLSELKRIEDYNLTYENYVKKMINADCWKVTVLPNDSNYTPYTDNILTDDKINIHEGHTEIFNSYIKRDKNFNSDIRGEFTSRNYIISTFKEIRIYMFGRLEYIIVAYGGEFLNKRLANNESPFRIYNKLC